MRWFDQLKEWRDQSPENALDLAILVIAGAVVVNVLILVFGT